MFTLSYPDVFEYRYRVITYNSIKIPVNIKSKMLMSVLLKGRIYACTIANVNTTTTPESSEAS